MNRGEPVLPEARTELQASRGTPGGSQPREEVSDMKEQPKAEAGLRTAAWPVRQERGRGRRGGKKGSRREARSQPGRRASKDWELSNRVGWEGNGGTEQR